MASGSAICLDNQPRPPHRFNHDIVGRGREHVNHSATGDRCIIRIEAAVSLTGPLYPVFSHVVPVACHICTDTGPTVFQGGIADRLKLRPVNPFMQRITTFVGGYTGWWSKHEVWLSLGPDDLRLKVWFPVVRLGHHRWQWQYAFPNWNVLGMRDVLDRRMLCATSEHVYCFERL